MNHSQMRTLRLIAEQVGAVGVKVLRETKHLTVEFTTADGVRAQCTFGRTPSDVRALRNQVRDAKRALQKMRESKDHAA